MLHGFEASIPPTTALSFMLFESFAAVPGPSYFWGGGGGGGLRERVLIEGEWAGLRAFNGLLLSQSEEGLR